MAKFCVNCGTRLEDGARFCTNCGTPSAPAAQPQQQPQRQPAEKTENSYSKQPAYKQQGYWQSQSARSGGGQPQKSKAPIVIAAVILIAAVIIACVFIFGGSGGSGKTNQNADSLREYAQRLEKAGNEEAAAAVYDLIAQGGSADIINNINENVPLFNAINELAYLDEIAYDLDGGE